MNLFNTFTIPFFSGLAVHLDGILFFLLIGITALLRLLAKKAKDAKEDEEEVSPASIETPRPLPRRAAETDEERIRRFLEALGQPTSAQPPAPIKPRTTPPPLTEFQRRQIEVANSAARRRNVMNPVPPLTTVPRFESPPRVMLPRPLATGPAEARVFAPQAAETTVFEVQGGAEPAQASASPGTAAEAARVFESAAAPAVITRPVIRRLLGSSEDLRRAISLREVFGPPRGLQALDSIGAEGA